MCGRFTLLPSGKDIASLFALDDVPDWTPRYNIAPTQKVLAVLNKSPRRASLMRWGLVPVWASDKGPPLINARAETAAEKPTFRDALKKRRCLVPADGFYEWKADGREKTPHHFTLAGGGLFAIAGVWEPRGLMPEEAGSVALLTTAANELVAPCHDRMPVILPPEAWAAWLGEATPDAVAAMLRPFPAEAMSTLAVGKAVGSVRSEGPACVEAAGPSQLSLF